MSKSIVELSSSDDFLQKTQKLNKTQLQSYLSEELFQLRNAFKADDEVSFSSLIKVYFYQVSYHIKLSHSEIKILNPVIISIYIL